MKNEIKMFLSSGGTLPKAIKKLFQKEKTVSNYLESVLSNNIWSNDFDKSIPIYQIYNHIHSFLDECKTENNKFIAPDGKIRKVLFLGYDGMRADMTAKLIYEGNEFDNTLPSLNTVYSGINTVRKDGGLYLAYCGGETGTGTEQTTSTSAGWTAQFTGVWGNKNSIKTNNDSKNMRYLTFLLEYAKKGLAVSLNFDWDPFFDDNLKYEIEYAMAHPELKIKFCDTDRKKGSSKKGMSQTFSDFISPENVSPSSPFDTGVRDYVLHRINNEDDIVCGIYHSIDTMGHMFEFSPNCAEYANAAMTCDNFTYQILKEIEKREKELNEDWLIVLANDHGGIGKGHGGQTLEERTTWIASNIPVNEKLFGYNYDGYREWKKQ